MILPEKLTNNNDSHTNRYYFFKKNIVKMMIPLFLMSSCGKTTTIIVKKGDSLGKIIQENYGVNINGKEFNEITKKIAEDNGLESADVLHVGDTIYIKDIYLKKYIKDSMKKKSKEGQSEKKDINTIKNPEYIEIKDSKDFKKKSDEYKNNNKNEYYLINKLYQDKNQRKVIEEKLNQGYSIMFLKEVESKDTPILTLDEIIKPTEIIDNKLAGKTFVLDPGHGGQDVGAICFSPYGSDGDRLVIVYEAPVMMDIVYRLARAIKSHGGSVKLTHYNNHRGIYNQKDPAPCSRYFDNGMEVYQDVWSDEPNKSTVIKAGGECLNKRAKIGSGSDYFISIHFDVVEGQILSIKYKTPGSKEFAETLLKKGFCYEFKGNKVEGVHYEVQERGNLAVLRNINNSKTKAILIESGNGKDSAQAYRFRTPEGRQSFVDKLGNSIIESVK